MPRSIFCKDSFLPCYKEKLISSLLHLISSYRECIWGQTTKITLRPQTTFLLQITYCKMYDKDSKIPNRRNEKTSQLFKLMFLHRTPLNHIFKHNNTFPNHKKGCTVDCPCIRSEKTQPPRKQEKRRQTRRASPQPTSNYPMPDMSVAILSEKLCPAENKAVYPECARLCFRKLRHSVNLLWQAKQTWRILQEAFANDCLVRHAVESTFPEKHHNIFLPRHCLMYSQAAKAANYLW